MQWNGSSWIQFETLQPGLPTAEAQKTDTAIEQPATDATSVEG